VTSTEDATTVAPADRPAPPPQPEQSSRPPVDGSLPGGREWLIASAGHEATVVEVGGGLRRYTVDGVDLLDGYPADELPRGCRGQILAPWANRIRDGEYSFAGQDHQLPIGEIPTHTAFHGMVRWQGWEPQIVESDSIVLTTVLQASDGYPFTIALAVRYDVGPDGLRVAHTATNIGRSAAPFMLATHCYPTVVGLNVDQLRLRVPAHSYLPTDERNLPLPSQPVADTQFDFADGPIFGDRVVDNAFGDLDRDADGLVRVTITATDGHGVALWSGDSFDWLQVYSSDTQTGLRFRRSFAVEPMTGPPDNFRSGADLISLQPGQQWSGRWGIHPVQPEGAVSQSGQVRQSADGSGGTRMSPPVTGTARDLLPDATIEEAKLRHVDPVPIDSVEGIDSVHDVGDDDERITREIPPHSAG